MQISSEKQYILDSISPKNVYLTTGGPGTGKTLLGILVGQKLLKASQPWQKILYLTYSKLSKFQIINSADKLLKNRLISNEVFSRIEVHNYHSLWWELIRHYRGFLGISQEPLIYSQVESQLKNKQDLEQMLSANIIPAEYITNNGKLNMRTSNKLVKQFCLSVLVEQWGRANLGLHIKLPTDDSFIKKASILIKQRNIKGWFSHDETIFWAYQIFNKHPTALNAFQQKYPVLVIDEFQDTDVPQWEMVKLISPSTLIVMADSKQTIHQWRGADPQRLVQLEKWAGPRFIHKQLYISYRSSRNMWEENNIEREILEHKIPNAVKPLLPFRILNLLKQCNGKSVAILCLTNELADYCAEKLRAKNQSCYRLGANYSPIESAKQILLQLQNFHTSLPNLQEYIANELIEFFFPRAAIVTSKSKKKNKERWIKAGELAISVQANYSNSIFHLIVYLKNYADISNTSYDKGVLRCLGYVARRLTSIHHLQWEKLSDLQKRQKIEGLIIQFENLAMHDLSKKVYVTTVHQSKGREFDIVIIPWFATIQWSQKNGLTWDFNLEERVNLFYTACSRAKERAIVIGPKDNMPKIP